MKSSFSRNFCTAAIILLLALTVLGASFQIQVNQYMEDTTISGLQQDSVVIANLAAAYSVDGKLNSRELRLNLDVISQVTDSDVVVCDRRGYILLCSNALGGNDYEGWQINQDYLNKVIDNGGDTATGILKGLYDDQRYIASSPIISNEEAKGIVMVSSPTSATNQILNRISNIFLTAAVFVVLLAVLAVTAFARRESQPLKKMAKAANAFAHGNLKARVKLEDDYSEEMEELALAFNNMAISLEKSEYQRQEFVANVSHELKTPMTTIAGFADGILDGTIPPEKQEQALRTISSETRRLSRLTRRMLDLSRLQNKDITAQEPFDIVELCARVLVSLEGKISEKKLDVGAEFPEEALKVWGDPDAITQVCYNLLDNAIKFSREGGHLWVSVTAEGGKAYVSVRDEGETIPPQELPLIFDRFHKSDKSRAMDREGVGLGLYIVKTILNEHKENITVTSEDGLTEFKFTLTLA